MNWLQEHYGNTEGPLGFPMPDRSARQLDTLLKSLPKSKAYDYRKIVSTKGVSELGRAS